MCIVFFRLTFILHSFFPLSFLLTIEFPGDEHCQRCVTWPSYVAKSSVNKNPAALELPLSGTPLPKHTQVSWSPLTSLRIKFNSLNNLLSVPPLKANSLLYVFASYSFRKAFSFGYSLIDAPVIYPRIHFQNPKTPLTQKERRAISPPYYIFHLSALPPFSLPHPMLP